MEDFEHPSSGRALAAFRSGDTATLLYRYAQRRIGDDAKAKDLVADALGLVCDAEDGRPWDPERGPLLSHMRIVIDDLARRERRSARARRETVDNELAFDTDRPDGAPLPDAALSEQRALARQRRLGARLRPRLTGLPLRVFDRTCEGADDAASLAESLGVSAREIYRAREAIAYHAKAVLAEEEAEEATHMRELRDQDRAKKTEAT